MNQLIQDHVLKSGRGGVASREAQDRFAMRAHFAVAFTLAMSTPVFAQGVGVPNCDNILKTYEVCVMPNAPDAVKGQLKTTFDKMRTNWTAVAATDDGKKQLEKVCVETVVQMKKYLASYNCAW